MNNNEIFNDPLIDGHETQADFEAEIQAEADSGLPQLCSCGELMQDCDGTITSCMMSRQLPWIGTKYCEKCDLIGRQFCQCNSIPTLGPILLAPAGLTVDDRTYWHRRAQDLLGQPVTIVS